MSLCENVDVVKFSTNFTHKRTQCGGGKAITNRQVDFDFN